MFKILAVNFHYVHPSQEARYPGLHRRTLEEFRNQLDVLADTAEYVSPQQLQDLLEDSQGVATVEKGFVLTFDDGLKDHARYVAPELDRRGWKAFFFVNTAPWEGEFLDVHRLQLLNATVPFPELYAAFLELVQDGSIGVEPEAIPMERVRQQYRYDEDRVARFKFAVNFELTLEAREKVLRALFGRYLGRDEEHAGEMYLSQAECMMLAEMGHTVGSHSHRHRALSLMSPSVRAEDIARSTKSIQDVTGRVPTWFSFPYGSKDAMDEQVLEECRLQGIRYGFSMQRGLIELGAVPIALNRVDTNDAPGGKVPSIRW